MQFPPLAGLTGPSAGSSTDTSDPQQPPPPAPDWCVYGPNTAEELNQAIVAEVAKVAREILAKADHNTREYASIIYRGSDGRFTHTPLVANNRDERGTFNTSGMGPDDWKNTYAMIHSHPEQVTINGVVSNMYDPNNPSYLTFPSEQRVVNGEVWGDWLSHDSVLASVAHYGGNTGLFSQYILGYNTHINRSFGVAMTGYSLHNYHQSRNRHDSSDAARGVPFGPLIWLGL